MKPGPAGRRVMDVVREMAPAGATVAQMARAAGSNQARAAEARIVLRHSASLAEAVSAGRIGLTTAWRQARQGQQKQPVDLDAVTDLSVAELARLLQVCTNTVYTHIKNGHIRADPGRRPLRIPSQAVRDYLASSGGRRDMLTRGQAAAALRISPRQVTSLAHRGLLSYERTPGGHARFPDASVRELMTGSPDAPGRTSAAQPRPAAQNVPPPG